MTARALRLAPGLSDPLSITGLVDSALRSGGAISLSFADGVVQVMLDQMGDWTITAALSLLSDRLVPLTKAIEGLGFFQATEESGMVYHLWTSALDENHDRNTAEETLLQVLQSFQSHYSPGYIS
jgi:hypothetical protein